MNWVKGFACFAILAGVGVFLTGELMHVGIILLIEGGVLLTLAEKKPKQRGRSRERSG
jgi:hypothetical protein